VFHFTILQAACQPALPGMVAKYGQYISYLRITWREAD
jgi:hypothetical protein